MNWNRLKKNRCPKCNKYLDFKSDQGIESETEMLMCTIKCGFMISHQKFAEICADKTSKKIEYEIRTNTGGEQEA